MDSRDYTSRFAAPDYEDDDPAEEHSGLAVLCLSILTVLFGLFILLPLVLFSPVVLLFFAIVKNDKEPAVVNLPAKPIYLRRYHSRIGPATNQELAVERIAG